jgi:hypothetical protein
MCRRGHRITDIEIALRTIQARIERIEQVLSIDPKMPGTMIEKIARIEDEFRHPPQRAARGKK